MAQTHGYGYGQASGLQVYGTAYTYPSGMEQVGDNLPTSLQDGQDTTLVRWSSNAFFGYAFNDTRIPTASTGTIVYVNIRYSKNIPSGADYHAAKFRSGQVDIGTMPDSPDPGDISASSTTDGNGGSLTPANFAATYWGAWANGNGSYVFRMLELSVTYTFTLPTPTATTNPATGVSSSQATLNAAVNPNTATSTYPVTYYFQWGLTGSFGNTTATHTLTGSGSNSVSETITGLSAGTTYYFRVVAYNADTTVYGDTVNFTAGTPIISARRGFASL